MSLDTLRTAVADTLKTALPASVSVESHGGRFDQAELRRIMAKAPAVFVATLGFSDLKYDHGDFQATISWGAFVVTRDAPKVSRDQGASVLVNALAMTIPENTWSLDNECVNTPQAVRGDNLFSATVDKLGVAMWAITWRQTMLLGKALSDEDLAALDLFETLYTQFPVADDAPLAEDKVQLPQGG
ncbi:phage protein Gp37 [Pseudodesulfovibrio indicus]|uniref:Uncharacterized protein DUF1834 n=1 Tax=Pseudodesulfovibrio indicus TaxID=1716143 RepID=A0A140D8Y1_9BACT|nr:phage protein Gp37 [Pseudodesulfovibrio indicus]AMK09648.1 hypothetical protein AWY79_00260 [Pseudodesulfovibrio indicus]TDT86400.1 uncharacterized protein DUF1834 [Pseudodesulfovibrio indicus]